MAVESVKPEEFASALCKILSEWEGLVASDVERVTREMSKETRDRVKRNIKTKGLIRTGAYLKSWRVKTKSLPRGISATIYAAAPSHRLTHLLEKGHAKVGGGRVPAYPHISEAERWAVREYEERLKEAIESHD